MQILIIRFSFLLSFTIVFWACEKHNLPQKEFNIVYGGGKDDRGDAIVSTPDGGFVIAGSTDSNSGDVHGNNGGTDAWLLKIDANGKKIWQKTFGGTNTDHAYALMITSDGSFVLAGVTSSATTPGYHGSTDAWVIKTDQNGNLLWQKAFGGTNSDELRGIVETTDGDYLVTGSTYSNDGDVIGNHGGADAWLLKTNGNGLMLWSKTFGGSLNDAAYCITATADKKIAIAGASYSKDNSMPQNRGADDIWIAKLTEDGYPVWQRTIGGSQYEEAYGITETADQGFVIAGSTSSNDGNIPGNHNSIGGNYSDVCLARMDLNGKLLWVKTWGGFGHDGANDITTTADGGFMMAGYANSRNDNLPLYRGGYSDAWVMKVDARGNYVWQQNIGGSGQESASAIKAIPRKGYIITGGSSSNDGDILFNKGGSDLMVATFNNDN